MKKDKDSKMFFNYKSFKYIIVIFASAPLLINIGLMITDVIYEYTGYTLTAYGLNNEMWLDFWKQYLAIVISFVGIYLVYISAEKDRKKQLYENNAQQYLDEVRREENVLVDVAQSFNMSVVYDAILKQAISGIFEGRKILADSRTEVMRAHVKFEILTEICVDLTKCETCVHEPCTDKVLMINLKNLFYDMEKHYFDMLESGERFLERLCEEQKREKLLNIEERIYHNTEEIRNFHDYNNQTQNEIVTDKELKDAQKRIEELKKSKLEIKELNKLIEPIQKEKDYIEKEMRPRFIGYCKAYINEKKNHAVDLRNVGYIKYKKQIKN